MEFKSLIQKYYDSFNKGDVQGMLSCLHSDFTHDVNESSAKTGKESFKEFLQYMNEHYQENLENIVVMSDGGVHYSAKFIVNGTYLKTDGKLPTAHGQKYKIPAATFFEIKEGLIQRVTTYYNLNEWIRLVSL